MQLTSNGGAGSGARRKLNLSVTLPPTLTPLTATQHVPPEARRVLHERGYEIERFLKQSLYGCCVVARPPPAKQTAQMKRRVCPLPPATDSDGATDADCATEANSDADVDPSSLADSGLVCVKMSRLVLATQLTSPSSDGRLTAVRDRTLSEGRLLQMASSDHVVSLIDEFSEGEFHFLITEFAGPELHSIVAAQPLPPHVARLYMRQLASALSTLHARGIAHLDLSLTNCCVDGAGRLRLIDFGVADVGDKHDVGAAAIDQQRPLANVARVATTVMQQKQAQQQQLQLPVVSTQQNATTSRPSSIELPRSFFSSIAHRLQADRASEAAEGRDSTTLAESTLVSELSSSTRRESGRFVFGSEVSTSRFSSRTVSPSPSIPSCLDCESLNATPDLHGASMPPHAIMRSMYSTPPPSSSSFVAHNNNSSSVMTVVPSSEESPAMGSRLAPPGLLQQRRPSSTMLPPPVLPILVSTPKRVLHTTVGETPLSGCIVPSALCTPSCARFEGAASVTASGSSTSSSTSSSSASFMSPASVSSTPHSMSSLSWPSGDPTRLRADLPPSKPHCQSPEQRACVSYHTATVAPIASASSGSVSVGNNGGNGSGAIDAVSTSQPLWDPFQADIFQLGVCAFEMLTGERWQAESPSDQLAHPLLPPDAARLIQQCTAPASERITISEILAHPFLAAEE